MPQDPSHHSTTHPGLSREQDTPARVATRIVTSKASVAQLGHEAATDTGGTEDTDDDSGGDDDATE